jgi:threonine dehydratase
VGRPHGGDQARERALRTAARVEAQGQRTPMERLRALDAKLGAGVGAKRERMALEAKATAPAAKAETKP